MEEVVERVRWHIEREGTPSGRAYLSTTLQRLEAIGFIPSAAEALDAIGEAAAIIIAELWTGPPEGFRRCTVCERDLPIDDFAHVPPSKVDKHVSDRVGDCRQCSNLKVRKRYGRLKEGYREQLRARQRERYRQFAGAKQRREQRQRKKRERDDE